MKHLSLFKLTGGRGESKALVMKKQGVPWIMAIVWVDCDCQYFVSMASSLKKGKEYTRNRWRQPGQDLEHLDTPNNQDAVRQKLELNKTKHTPKIGIN